MTTTSAVLMATTLGWTASAGYALHLFKRLHTDPLTGLGNRAILEIIAHRAAHSRRGGSVGLLLLDLDRFKAVNDTHGHAVGNHVLRVLGARLAATRRHGEFPIRLHGDEFALWLGHLPHGARGRQLAARRAEQIQRVLAEPITVAGTRLTIAASIGAHLLPAAGLPLPALLAGADAAMYSAKRGGRLSTLPTTGRLRDHQAHDDTSERESA
ncbi:GGDEF domain-containing protein [Umezawaea sp. Da 62-37]|uniref:GGDEF domain-containing protein n=1 Tax=Umezawaea sp. Da 62-37 TaxID=3075927 RepID=UPI0028F7199C|nr:GGDEF domain-containing protein [Umezawaea sp. Da 62-37]WNV83246.1 GGDEF domain-containing protein [Umezawaea sp. Da 62-37]